MSLFSPHRHPPPSQTLGMVCPFLSHLQDHYNTLRKTVEKVREDKEREDLKKLAQV